MAKRGDPEALRLVVTFLRAYARMTQSELGKACGLAQARISSYESGEVAPPEDVLRRMAQAVGIDEALVGQVRQFYQFLLTRNVQAQAEDTLGSAGEDGTLPPELLPYALELLAEEAAEPSPEEARWEAETIWAALERYPVAERGRLVGMTLHAAGNWALAERCSHESDRRAAENAEEAVELAALAVEIAERVPGEESWRSRVQGYCWAHLATAREAAGDLPGAEEAANRARELWSTGALSDRRWLAPERVAERIGGLQN